MVKPGRALGVLAMLLMLSSAFIIAFPQGSQASAQSGSTASSSSPLGNWPPALAQLFGPEASNPRIQFGLSFWTISDFNSLTNNCQTVQCYSDVIQKYLLPHNIYWVPIYQYSDANTSSACQGSMCLQADVNNLLTAGDKYGMHFLFYFAPWGFDGGGESSSCNIPVSQSGDNWQTEVLNYWAAKLGVPPTSLAEVSSTGGTVCVLRQDYVNLWTLQMERDIYEVYRTYGSHPSFTGFIQYWEFSTGYGSYDGTGYSMQTQANYTASPFSASGDLQGYLHFEFEQVLVNAVNYCQTLIPDCIIINDQPSVSSPIKPNNGFTNYAEASLFGGGTQGSWPSTYGTNDEGAVCSPTFNCGIFRGSANPNIPERYDSSGPYIASEAVGFRCYPSGNPMGATYSCNNNAYNTVEAIPYELTATYPSQVTPLIWIQTSAASLVSNFTNDANNDIPPNVGATTGQDYLYNERSFAYVASNTVYVGRELGYASKPLANILLVNSDPADGNSYAAANFLTQQFLQSVGFNLTATTVSQVKHLNLLRFNAILWTSLDQPNEANATTYNDIINAVNNGVGFILVGNAGSGYGGGTGITSTTLNNLFGLTYPVVGCCYIPNNPAPISNMNFNTASSAAQQIFSPFNSLSMSDFVPNMSPPEEYLYSTTGSFTSKGGIVLATATSSGDGQSFPVMVAVNGTGPGQGRMLWLGTTYDTSGLYGSYVSSGLYTKQLDVYINMLLYASKQDSMIPYIYASSSQPSYYPGITFSMLGTNSGSDLVWFSDYTAPGTPGGSYTQNIDYEFRASAMGISGNWIALNLANMEVVNQGSSAAISLPLTMENETWAPVYVTNLTPSNLGLVYDNSVLKGETIGTSSAMYTLSGPPDSGSWLVVRDSSGPNSVSAGGTSLTQYSSLSSLVSATEGAYMQTNPNNWTPASGWYFDPANQLLYIAYVGGSSVPVTISQPGSTTSTSSVSQTSTISTTTTASASTSTTSTTSSTSTTMSTSSTTSGSGTSTFSFALSASPTSGSVSQGGSVSTIVSAQLLSGTAQPVTFYAPNLPSGISALFSSPTDVPNFESTMTMTASTSTPPGNYVVTVTAVSGTRMATLDYTLTVSQAHYSLTTSSSSAQGGAISPSPGTYSYSPGANVTVTAEPAPGWSLSQWVVNGRDSGNGSSITFSIARDMKVEAVFAQMVAPSDVATVSISSTSLSTSIGVDGKNYSLPVSFDWTIGSRHTISASEMIQVSKGERSIFTGWSGSIPATSSNLTIVVSRNVALLPTYTSQYHVALAFVDENGLPLKPSNVALVGKSFDTTLSPNMSAWLDTRVTYTVTQAYWMNANVLSGYTLSPTHAGSYIIPLSVYSDTVKIVDVYGLPIQGAVVQVAVGNGVTLTRTTGANGTANFSQVPLGTYSGTVSYMGLHTDISSSNLGNQNSTVTMVLSYPFLSSMGLFSILALAVVYRKRSAAKRLDPELAPIS